MTANPSDMLAGRNVDPRRHRMLKGDVLRNWFADDPYPLQLNPTLNRVPSGRSPTGILSNRSVEITCPPCVISGVIDHVLVVELQLESSLGGFPKQVSERLRHGSDHGFGGVPVRQRCLVAREQTLVLEQEIRVGIAFERRVVVVEGGIELS